MGHFPLYHIRVKIHHKQHINYKSLESKRMLMKLLRWGEKDRAWHSQ